VRRKRRPQRSNTLKDIGRLLGVAGTTNVDRKDKLLAQAAFLSRLAARANYFKIQRLNLDPSHALKIDSSFRNRCVGLITTYYDFTKHKVCSDRRLSIVRPFVLEVVRRLSRVVVRFTRRKKVGEGVAPLSGHHEPDWRDANQ